MAFRSFKNILPGKHADERRHWRTGSNCILTKLHLNRQAERRAAAVSYWRSFR
jgi:hypothetical protein